MSISLGLSLFLVAWTGFVAFLRYARAWLLYFIAGAVGFTLAVVYLVRGTAIEYGLESLTALHVHQVASLVGIPTRIFTSAKEILLVMIISQDVGWTAMTIDIECSGLLELTVFMGLLLFFPKMPVLRKLVIGVLGLLATYVFNLIRVMAIAAVLHWGGKNAIFIAHTIVGRGIFFVCIVAIYWFAFTRGSLQLVADNMKEAQ